MGLVSAGFSVFVEEDVQDLVQKMPWMKDCDMQLCNSVLQLQGFVNEIIAKGDGKKKPHCCLDLETTGLNTRRNKQGKPIEKIVGIALAISANRGIYIPINHKDKDENLPEQEVLAEIKRLCQCTIIIVHHAKFDLQFLKNYGIVIDSYEDYEDTLILARLHDTGQKDIGLKYLSDKHLGRKMIEFKEVTKGTNRFDVISPKIGYVYAASDSLCTYGLFELYINHPLIVEQMKVYYLEKRLVPVVMQMEANLIKIDKAYLEQERVRVSDIIEKKKKNIHDKTRSDFNIGSTQQLGKMLFEELGYEYPEKKKTASGLYMTDTGTLEKIEERYPIVKDIIAVRKLEKSLGTYIENLLNNCDEDGFIKVGFNQTGTDTGRFSSPGGKGIHEDGYCGANVQSIPSNYSDDAPDVRRAFIARPGKKIVACDFSGEELRVTANLSKEKKWIDEFLYGSADLHTTTGKAVFKKDEISKAERQIAKTLNFQILYGSGPRGIAENAKISETEARRAVDGFLQGLPILAAWIKAERNKARKLKYVKTPFGRIRPLQMFYDSGDRGLEAHADRASVNFLVQGCLKGSEKVLTDRGYLPILAVKKLKEANIPIKVWTGTSWETFNVLDRGEWQLATIELHNGMKLECDTRHQVLTVGQNGYEFKKFEDLDEDTKICVSVPQELSFGVWPESPKEYYKNTTHNRKSVIISNQEDWVNVAYILGYIIGDGSVNNYQDAGNRRWSYSTTFTFGKEKLDRNFSFLNNCFNKMGLTLSEPKLNPGSIGEAYTSRCDSASFIELLTDIGYNFSQKRVPAKVFTYPLEMRRAFLRGFFDTDGSKKPENRYNFHTPNKELLQDTQLLAWSLGAASRIFRDSAGAYLLNWECMADITAILNLECSTRYKYRGRDMILPKFMHGEVLSRLEEKRPFTNAEKALASKLRTGKNVTTQSMIQFLRSKNCELPTMYYYYRLKSKITHEIKESTYTLSVDSPLHRFESAGIISKNSCADIMKICMVRIDNWIKSKNLQDDIKILLTMHDEIVFEMTETRLSEFIPQINDMMGMGDVLQDTLGWPVPLTIDAEYGDSWHADHDFFKEHPELKNVVAKVEFHQATQIVEEPLKTEADPQALPEADKEESPVIDDAPLQIPSGETGLEESKVTEEDDTNEEIFFMVKRLDGHTVWLLNAIINFLLKECDMSIYKGPKKIIRIQDKSGFVMSISNLKIRSDGFYSLARFWNL